MGTREVLLGGAALVGTAPVSANPVDAQIEVTLSGYTELGARYAADEALVPDRGYGFFMDNRVVFLAKGTDDGTGITYGTNIELEVGTGGEEGTDTVTDKVALFFSGGFGRVELGREDGAEDVMMLGGESVAAGTGGIDGDLPIGLTGGNIPNSADAAKVTYFTPRFAGLQAGVSYAPDAMDGGGSDDVEDASDSDLVPPEGLVGAGLNLVREFAGLYLGAAAVLSWAEEEGDGDGPISWSAGGTVGFAGLSLGGSYGYHKFAGGGEIGFATAGVGFFGLGPANASFTYEFNEREIDDNAHLFVVSADAGLMPGVVLKGDLGLNTEVFLEDEATDAVAGVLTVQLNY